MIGAAIRKDIALLLRDRSSLISLFLLPIIFIATFGAMFSFGPDRGEPRPIAIWHAPGDPRGEAIAKTLSGTPGFVARPATSADDARAQVAREDVSAALIVPTSSPADRDCAEPSPGCAGGEADPVELAIDLGAPIQVRAPLQGALAAVVQRALAPVPERARVVPRSPPGIARPLANISSFQVTVPGNAVLFGFFIALTVGISFVNERRTGTWRRLLAAPVPRWKALLATLVPYYLIGIAQLAFLFGIGAAAFGMRIAGSPAALVALSLALVLCSVALGLLFAALARTEKQLGGIGSVVLLVMGMLGGCMFPRLAMPEFMKTIGLAVPHGWALDGYYAVLVREGTTLADVLPSLGALLAFAAAFAGLGLALFRFER